MTKKTALDQISIRTLNAFSKINPEFEDGTLAKDAEHAAFIAKSEYDLPQLSTKITFMKIGEILIPIANGTKALVGIAFKQIGDEFQTLNLTCESWSQMEKVA